MQNNFKLLDHYKLIRRLSVGKYGKVYLAFNTKTLKPCAIKIFIGNIDNDITSHKSEFQFTNLLNHRNIVKAFDFSSKGMYTNCTGVSSKKAYFTLELVKNGCQGDFVRVEPFSEPVACYFFCQQLDSLKHCHDNGIAHRDLKFCNIMLNDTYEAIIVDFGFAGYLKGKDGSGFLDERTGTPNFAAPEILSGKNYRGMHADMFSLGVILLRMVIKQEPFKQASLKLDKSYKKFVENPEEFWEEIQKKTKVFISEDFKSLITEMLKLDPEERITVAGIFEHRWYQKNCEIDYIKFYQEFNNKKSQMSDNDNIVTKEDEEKLDHLYNEELEKSV